MIDRNKANDLKCNSSPCRRFYLDGSSHGDYVDGFKLTEREFELLSRELSVESRRFIVKQGHNSVVAELNLRGFDDELDILTGRTANVELAEAIRAEVGDRIEDWLPLFQQGRRTD